MNLYGKYIRYEIFSIVLLMKKKRNLNKNLGNNVKKNCL